MAVQINQERFIALLSARFPEVAANIDECAQGLLHLEMGALARATQAALSDEDISTVKVHFGFIDEIFRLATPEVKNAVYVSYLECLSFDGRHGKRIKARDLLSAQLQEGLRNLEAYNEALFRSVKRRRTGR